MQNSRMIKVLSGEVQGKRKGGIVPGWRQILMASLIYLSRTAGTWLRYFSCCLREGRGLPALPRWFDCMICCCRLLMYSFTPSKVLCCSNALSFLVWALSASGQSITEPPVFLFEGVLSQTLTLCACKRNCLKVSTWTRPPPQYDFAAVVLPPPQNRLSFWYQPVLSQRKQQLKSESDFKLLFKALELTGQPMKNSRLANSVAFVEMLFKGQCSCPVN